MALEAAVRTRWPSAGDVLVADVVDLHKVPSMFRRVAEGVLQKEHRQAVDALSPGLDPYDHVVLLPDWNGAVAKALGLEDPTQQLGWAVINPAGEVLAAASGSGTDSSLIQAIETAFGRHL